MTAPVLVSVDPAHIIQRYLSDESTKDIAASYGVTRQALNLHLLAHAEDKWRDAQVARAIARKEAAEDALDSTDTPLDGLALARARERLRAAQWDLERVCRRIYGQDVPQHIQAVQINISLRRAGATVAAQHGDNGTVLVDTTDK